MASNQWPAWRSRPALSLALHITLAALLIWPAAATARGGEAFFLTGIYGSVIIVCTLRVAWLLRSRHLRTRAHLRSTTGPLLALAISVAAIAWFDHQLSPVRAYARAVAAQVQAECDQHGRCPAAMAGWMPRHDMYSSMTLRGGRIKWPVLYRSDGREFTVTLYLLMESRIDCSGGVRRVLTC